MRFSTFDARPCGYIMNYDGWIMHSGISDQLAWRMSHQKKLKAKSRTKNPTQTIPNQNQNKTKKPSSSKERVEMHVLLPESQTYLSFWSWYFEKCSFWIIFPWEKYIFYLKSIHSMSQLPLQSNKNELWQLGCL